MDRAAHLFLLPIGLAVLASFVYLLGEPVGPPTATVLFATSALTSLLLAYTAPAVQWPMFRKNPQAAFGLMVGFNVAILVALVAEALALVTLFGTEFPLGPQVLDLMWLLPPILTILMALVVLERREGTEPPRPNTALRIVVATLTAIALILWTNALLAGRTTLLFVTDTPLEHQQAIYPLVGGLLVQGVAAMVLLRVPTVFDLLVQRRDTQGRLRSLTASSPLLTTALFTATITAGTYLVTLQSDRIPVVGDFVPTHPALRILLILAVAVLSFLVAAGLLTLSWARGRLYRVPMPAQTKSLIALGILTYSIAAYLVWVTIQLHTDGSASLLGLRLDARWRSETLVAALLVATGPLGFWFHRLSRKQQYLEERLADFLTDLAETSKAGLSLHSSLQAASRKDYGPLNPEIERMAHQVSWGLPFAEAFRRFGERSKTKLVGRAANLVVESARSGGNTPDVLEAAAKDVFEIKALESDRRLAMTTYLIVIYVVFLVFLAILAVLAITFVPQLLATTQSASGSDSGLFANRHVTPEALSLVYFHAVLVQAAGNGLVAGVIRDNQFAAGLRHVFFMVLIGWLAFRIFIL